MKTYFPLAIAVGIAVILSGCDSDSTGPEAGSTEVTLSVSMAPANGTPGANLTIDDGVSTLILTRVAVVLREIELEGDDDDCNDDSGGDCEEFEAGPLLLELGLDGNVDQVITINPSVGTYDELEFEIHKPDDDDADDLTFITANPDFADVSIRVEGSFDGQAFVFTQDLNEEQERELNPPLVVGTADESVNITLVLDASTWFVNPANGELIDPRTANKEGPNEELVEELIKMSIDLFEDDDEDGEPDGN